MHYNTNRFLLGAVLSAYRNPRLDPAVERLLDSWRPRNEAEWQHVMRQAIRFRLMPAFARHIERKDTPISEIAQELATVTERVQEAFLPHLFQVVESLERNEIEVMVLKGADLIFSVHGPKLAREIYDFDLLIKPTDLDTSKQVMEHLGYVQANVDRNGLQLQRLSPAVIAEAEVNHYETAPFVQFLSCPALSSMRPLILEYLERKTILPKGASVYLVLAFDLHFNLAVGLDLDDVWRNLRQVNAPEFGASITCQGATEMFWFLAARCYSELFINNANTYRSFVDVIAFYAQFSDEIDVDRLTELCNRYGTRPALYYSLNHLSKLVGDRSAAEAAELLSPRSEPDGSFMDYGDFVPRIMGGPPLVASLL
ncbi:hypothetical protein AY600_08760 [Phormidium willei BDU 130791]|nr:hypothetical protein AY600_08760 [Phormidium willei BDU 130791]